MSTFRELILEGSETFKGLEKEISKIFADAGKEYSKWEDTSGSSNDEISATEYNPDRKYPKGRMTVTFEDGAYDLYIGDKVIIKPTDKKSFFKAFAKHIVK
jgi:hypothetical protein